MRTIEVCIGSACHLKGSCEVIKTLQRLIKENKLEERVELKSAFCLGACGKDVSVRVDGMMVDSITPEDSALFFKERILGGSTHEVY